MPNLEPTTDKFTALFHNGQSGGGDSNDCKLSNSGFQKKKANDDAVSVVTDDIRASGRLLKGNTLTVTPNLPFSSLSQFGSAFLNHFVGSSASSPLLERLTFIDTPGVLSGEKQRINRTCELRIEIAHGLLLRRSHITHSSLKTTSEMSPSGLQTGLI